MTAWSFQKRFPDAVTLLTAFAIFISGFKSSFAQPSASFSAIPTVGCAPLTVAFSNTSSGANSYYWDFGNGNTSTLANPSTVYLTPGFFTVILIAINTSNGQRDTLTASNYIHTVTPPNADFSALPLAGCAGEAIISFTNSSTGAVTYTWDFGDGGTSTLQNPTHVYATAGNYTIKLIATNGFGCNDIEIKNNYITIHPKPNANFTSPVTSSCDSTDAFAFSNNAPGNILWLWDFGDGATSTLQNPTHVYNATGSFTVTLIATNNWGCTDTNSVANYINIGNSLVPSFTVNNSTGCGTLNAIFNCSVPNATSWSWNFGDGGASTLQNPSHLYTTTGNYNVTLTVTTTTGCNGTVTLPNYIVIDPL
ncbi:MAG: PKD domain-containing protein, partial [Bacteroidia bacterium]